MDLLERIWELLGLFFGNLLGGFERAITTVFGSSNARYIKKLQVQVDSIGALESKYKAMSDDVLSEETVEFRRRVAAGCSGLGTPSRATPRVGRAPLQRRHRDMPNGRCRHH